MITFAQYALTLRIQKNVNELRTAMKIVLSRKLMSVAKYSFCSLYLFLVKENTTLQSLHFVSPLLYACTTLMMAASVATLSVAAAATLSTESAPSMYMVA